MVLFLPLPLRTVVVEFDEEEGVHVVRIFYDHRFFLAETADAFASKLADDFSQQRLIDYRSLAEFLALFLGERLRRLLPEFLLRGPNVEWNLGFDVRWKIVALEFLSRLDDFPASNGGLFLEIAPGTKGRVAAQPRRLDNENVVASRRLLYEQDRVCDGHGAMELDLNLSLSSGLVAYCSISPSLDEVATAGAAGEFKVSGKDILLGNGEIGARLRSRCWGLSEGISLPLGVFLRLMADGVRMCMCRFSELANVGIVAV